MSKTYAKITRLTLSWSVSRGRDTYGYNICRLDDNNSGARYRCNGGGYDMIGTVFGNWLEAAYADRLKAYVADHASELQDCGYAVSGYKKLPNLYGLTIRPDGSVSLDGGCGISSMEKIAEAIGLEVQSSHNRKGHRIGWFVGEFA